MFKCQAVDGNEKTQRAAVERPTMAAFRESVDEVGQQAVVDDKHFKRT